MGLGNLMAICTGKSKACGKRGQKKPGVELNPRCDGPKITTEGELSNRKNLKKERLDCWISEQENGTNVNRSGLLLGGEKKAPIKWPGIYEKKKERIPIAKLHRAGSVWEGTQTNLKVGVNGKQRELGKKK